MKTYFKDFSMEATALIDNKNDESDDLESVITNRQNKFYKTVEYTKLNNKIMALIAKLIEASPEAKDVIDDLESEILLLECISYSAAYRDGMADVMTAITLNKLNVTMVECIEFGKLSPDRQYYRREPSSRKILREA